MAICGSGVDTDPEPGDRNLYLYDIIAQLIVFHSQIKELVEMEVAERKKIRYEFKLNKNKTVLRGETTLATLKQIIDPSNEKVFDWAFATNQNEIGLDYIVPTYKRTMAN